MRRRRRDEVPKRLAAFDADDWPASSWEDSLALWCEARRLWADQRGGWPGGALDLLRGESDVRRRHDGEPLRSWGRPGAGRRSGHYYGPTSRDTSVTHEAGKQGETPGSGE